MSVAADEKRRGPVSETPSASKSVRPPGGSRPDDARAFATSVGDVMRRERLLRKWTQAVVAEKAGLSPNYVARLERGELAPSLFVARRICDAFGISIDLLAGHTPRAPRDRQRRDSMLRRRPTAPAAGEEEE